MQVTDFTSLTAGQLVPTVNSAVAFVPSEAPRTIELDAATIGLLARAQHVLGKLSGSASRLVNPYLVSTPLLRREAILSSRIEGTIAAPQDVAIAELGVAGAPTADAKEIGNFVRATKHALDRLAAGDPIASRLLLDTHRILMEGVRGDRERPGEYRDTQNFIGTSTNILEARFVPPPHTYLSASLSDFERFINEDIPDMPSLIRAAVAHYQFEALHPFRDGNGRIGRLIITLLLVRDGILPGPLVPISSAFERRKSEYVDLLLAVSQKGDWTSWVKFFLDAIRESGEEALRLVESIDGLRAKWHGEFQQARSSALLLKLVDSLFNVPATTISHTADLLRVTPAAASANIRKLEEKGILREVTGRTRDRVYIASGIMNLTDDATNSGEKRA